MRNQTGDIIVDGIVNLLKFAEVNGTDAAARVTLDAADGLSLAGRRKTALFLAAFRGHRIGVERLIEQAYGYVGECALCGMICKVPREQAGGDAVQGRAVEFDCPCGRCPGPAKETA